MKIAVTAAGGQLGKAVIRSLQTEHPEVDLIGLARTPQKAQDLGVEILAGDYNDLAGLEDSLQSVDAVLLVSGMDEPSKRIEQHRNVIRAARANGVKRIVYTSIQGAEEGTAFSPVVQSNRTTEADVRDSGLDWVIGRNGIYIEPDIDYIDEYRKQGSIANCAADGRCGYTTRAELARAYAEMLLQDAHVGKTFNLHGEAITQYQLADYMNQAFGTSLSYSPMSVEAFRQDRIAELGEFLGTVIAGIYQGIREGKADNPSDYRQAAGREHESWQVYFDRLRAES